MIQDRTSTKILGRPTQRELLEIVGALSQAVRSAVEPARFYQLIVESFSQITHSSSAALWSIDEHRVLTRQTLVTKNDQLAKAFSDSDDSHLQLLRSALHQNEVSIIPNGQFDASSRDSAAALLIAPLRQKGTIIEVLEALLPELPNPSTQQGIKAFLAQLEEFVADWSLRRNVTNLEQIVAKQRQLEEFTQTIYQSLEKQPCAMAIVNEVRRLADYDRVSLAVCQGRRLRMLAVSGVGQHLKRSPELDLLLGLAEKVLVSSSELHYDGAEQELMPQVDLALNSYLDQSPMSTLQIVPLRHQTDNPDSADDTGLQPDTSPIGVLICERKKERLNPVENTLSLQQMQDHAGNALSRATEHENLFLFSLWSWLGKKLGGNRSTMQRRLTGIVIVAASLAGALFIPVDFSLTSQGTMEPVTQRHVFAETEGVVETVSVSHGQTVRAGEVLLRLRNTELEVKLADVNAQLQVATSRQDAIRRQRLEEDLPTSEGNRLWGELLQLQRRISGLSQQQNLLQAQSEQLVVRSPIDGQMITWEPQRELLDRPVARGETLVTVANSDGPWQLELYVPEQRAGHISIASKEAAAPLPVDYVAATNPETRLRGTLQSVDEIAEMYPEYGHAIRMTVEIDKYAIPDPRPGAVVSARVNCGERPLGYVLFHQVVEFLQYNVFFRFF